MKTIYTRLFVTFLPPLVLLLAIASCQREVNIDLDKGLSSEIQQIVPQAILDSLRKKGMVINEGLVPPQLNGIYFLDPDILQVPFGPGDFEIGHIFSSVYYKFYGQDATGEITYDYSTNTKSYAGIGQGAFISGNGNKFTIYSQEIGISQGIPDKQLTVISGEITATGIQGWQNSLIVTDKTGDKDNKLVLAIGQGRVFKDGDGLAVKTTYFPQSIKPVPGSQFTPLASPSQAR